MESVKVVITPLNCEEKVQLLVSILRGHEFSILPLRPGDQDIVKESIGHLKLYEGVPQIPGFDHAAGYQYQDGRLTILLNGGRKIYWDLNIERVELDFFDKGYITIKKDHLQKGVRTIMIFFD